MLQLFLFVRKGNRLKKKKEKARLLPLPLLSLFFFLSKMPFASPEGAETAGGPSFNVFKSEKKRRRKKKLSLGLKEKGRRRETR